MSEQLTKAEWEQVEEQLKSFFSPVALMCDGFHLALALKRIDTMKNAIAFYVNGCFKGVWFSEDCEERRRFFRPVNRSSWPASQKRIMKKLGKAMLKRMDIDPDSKYTTYHAWWTSFKALKAHLIKNNKSIELLKTWECPEHLREEPKP